jgi:hypothetical protein
MLSLTVIETPQSVKLARYRAKNRNTKFQDKDYIPTMPRAELKALTKRLMESPTLRGAAAILRETAKTMPQQTGTWGWCMLQLGLGLVKGKARFNVFKRGNVKLPFYSFSALPEFTCPGAGPCLDWCYSFSSWRYPTAWARQVQNTLFLKFCPGVIAHAFHQLPKGVVIRLYVDGDFDSAETIGFWMAMLASRPDLQAYGYSKSWRLLWDYAQRHTVPANYVLNLSSGERRQGVSRERMKTLPFVRGDFIAVEVDYRPEGHKGNIGFDRYKDPEYHRAVRKAAEERGMGKVFSCPGDCGSCCGGEHACGMMRLKVPVVIGIH